MSAGLQAASYQLPIYFSAPGLCLFVLMFVAKQASWQWSLEAIFVENACPKIASILLTLTNCLSEIGN